MLAVPYIPGAFAMFVVREREIKAKYQQIVSGVSIPAYWLSTWLFDVLCYQGSMWLIILIILQFDTSNLTGAEPLPATILLFFLYGTAVAGFSYLLSFCFRSAPGAQIGTVFACLLTGLALSIVSVFLRIFPETRDIYLSYLRFIFLLLPPFALADGLQSLALKFFFSTLELSGRQEYGVWDLSITGYPLLYLGVESVAYIALVIFIEYQASARYELCGTGRADAKLYGHLPTADAETDVERESGYVVWPNDRPEEDEANKDADVRAEEALVRSGGRDGDNVVLKNIKKTYPGGKRAVRGVSVGVKTGECFGLLGINGAGKSSCIAVLTGEVNPTVGDAFLTGTSVREDVHTCRRQLGYCPQFDALFDHLTGREHLRLYAKIKGIPLAAIPAVVEQKIGEMGLSQYADRGAWSYSGGTKRKLSVAIAMIGDPDLVFLDEPSTGMDPRTRRYMWGIITDIVTRRAQVPCLSCLHCPLYFSFFLLIYIYYMYYM
jgi:ABC-type Na+ transport system ATPase subunit NatA